MGLPRWLSGKTTCLPVQEMKETHVQSLGQKDPLEEEMATHSHVLAWRIPWTGEPGWLWSLRSQRIGHQGVTKHTNTHTHTAEKSPSQNVFRMP